MKAGHNVPGFFILLLMDDMTDLVKKKSDYFLLFIS